MNLVIIRVALATVSLAALLLTLACGGGASNGNANIAVKNDGTNTNVNAEEVSEARKSLMAGNPCIAAGIDARLSNVNAVMDSAFSDPKEPLHDQYNKQGGFKYQLVKGPPKTGQDSDSLYLYVEGTITGKNPFGVLKDAFSGVVHKKCVQKIVFVPPGSLPLKKGKDGRPVDVAGLEWNACDWPKVPCPGGECLDSCPTIAPGVSPTPTP